MSKVRDYKVSKLHETFVSNLEHMYEYKDAALIENYAFYVLNSGKLTLSYFEPYEEAYLELHEWFDDPNSYNREDKRERGARYVNQIYRIVSGELANQGIKYLHSFGDRKDAEKYMEALRTCSSCYTKTAFSKKGIHKTYKNPIKEMAWYVVHSYVTDYFLDAKHMKVLIDSIRTSSQIASWNSYIYSMIDIPREVKDIFIIKDSGKSQFQNWLNNR